jgi:hypothetical protein
MSWSVLVTILTYLLWCPQAVALHATGAPQVALAQQGAAITLTWNVVPNATSYRLYHWFASGTPERTDVFSPPVRYTALERQIHHKFHVTALGSQGEESVPSNQVSVITPPEAPFVLQQRVRLSEGEPVRYSPGGNPVGVQLAQALGTITAGPKSRGTNPRIVWWRVNFDQGKDGWVPEYLLRKPR